MADTLAQLDEFFPYRLAVTAEAFSQNLVNVYGKKHGLSREEWRLLYLLSGEHSLTSLELNKRTSLDKVQISRAAAKLEEKGLLSRDVASEDRRLKQYTCTAKGRSMFNEILPEVQARADLILASLKETDRQALAIGIGALSEAVQAVEDT